MACEPDTPSICASSCCNTQRKENRSDNACMSQTSLEARADYPSSIQNSPEEGPNKPSCCKDKPSPCCDVSCLDRIALRECEKGHTLPPSSSKERFPKEPPSPSCQSPDGKPCDQHRRSTYAKYAARLEALGCICRALIALGQESCCLPPKRSPPGKEHHSANSARPSLCASLDSCCVEDIAGSEGRRSECLKGKREACSSGCCGVSKGPGITNAQCAPASKGKAVKSHGCCSRTETSAFAGRQISATQVTSSDTMTCSKSKNCCGKPSIKTSSNTEQCSSLGKGSSSDYSYTDGCCKGHKTTHGSSPKEKPKGPDACSTSGCCSKTQVPPENSNEQNSRPSGCCSTSVPLCRTTKESSNDIIEVIPRPTTPDLERGGISKEHIVLSISGMTCTGCETKLKRTLGMLQSVQNLRTSLVLSRVEFDLDVGTQSVDAVLKHLKKTTEFQYERVTDRGSCVDVIVPNSSEFMKQDWPQGVTGMTPIDEKTVNIAFDAKIAGARDLVERGWSRPLNLATLRPDPTLQAGMNHVRHMGYMTMLSIILTVPVLVMAWAPLPEREIAYGSASLALATIVQFVIAGPFYPKALKALVFSRIIEMDLLIVLSTSAAYIFSVVSFGYLVAGRPLSTGEFFETSTLLVTLIMVGRYVTALARQKAVESISLRSLQMPTAILVDDSGANEREIDTRLLQYGDVFKVVPDSQIPTDGTVILGSSEVDESMISGEPMPVNKFPRSAVIAGSVNGSGTLIVKLTRLPADNTVSVIAGMVDQAKLSKAKIQDIADRVASYFVPVVVALTFITFVIWVAVGIVVRNQSGSRATTEAITYAITVLIVSCPCAIGLAVPMVIVIASGVAAERGIIFKAAESIEIAYKAFHVVFDKTGTLTQGKLTVAVEHIDGNTKDSMSLLLGLIGSNKHPISAAVAAHLIAKGIPRGATVPDATVLTGKGVEGSVPDRNLTLRAGNSRWLNLSSNPQVQSILEQGYTAFCFTINDTLAAVFGLEDSLRPDALETVTRLQERGISVHLLSGDDEGTVHLTARRLGIAAQNIRSRCSPADKQAYIQTLVTPPQPQQHTKKILTPTRTRTRTTITTIFVGDGTNDAPALATSTIGVHMNQETGSDVAKSTADVVLMRPNLLSVLTMIDISAKAVRRIKFNFGWSFVYNLFAILLGAGAFVNARIPPEFAGLGELVSVLPVVVAAVLLRWARV